MRAFIAAYMAASQSGKTTLIRQHVAALAATFPRRLWWDFKREYGPEVGELCATIPALVARLKAGAPSVIYRPSFDWATRAVEFDRFERIAIASVYARVPTLQVVEELSMVT